MHHHFRLKSLQCALHFHLWVLTTLALSRYHSSKMKVFSPYFGSGWAQTVNICAVHEEDDAKVSLINLWRVLIKGGNWHTPSQPGFYIRATAVRTLQDLYCWLIFLRIVWGLWNSEWWWPQFSFTRSYRFQQHWPPSKVTFENEYSFFLLQVLRMDWLSITGSFRLLSTYVLFDTIFLNQVHYPRWLLPFPSPFKIKKKKKHTTKTTTKTNKTTIKQKQTSKQKTKQQQRNRTKNPATTSLYCTA